MSDLNFIEEFCQQYEWGSSPAKRRFRFKKVINRGMVEKHRLALTLAGVIDRAIDDDEGLQASDYSTYQIFEKDDLVFKLIDLENIRTSRVGHLPRRGIMSPAYIRLQKSSKEVYPRYYYWFFYSVYVNNIFNGMGGGVRQNLTSSDLLEFPIPLPDPEIQRTVSDFLDHQTARIDQLIEKKQSLMELLDEKHMALITAAVTGQVDIATGKRRRVAELGSHTMTLQERVHGIAPPHFWPLKKLHKVLRVRKGNKNKGMQEDNLLSLSYGRVIEKDIETAEGLLPESFETYQIVEPGNIVMRLTDLQNDKRSLRQGLVKQRGIITSAYDVVEVRPENDPRFWAYVLFALDSAKYYYSLGGGVRQSIKFTDFPNNWIAVPSCKDQCDIADFLDRRTMNLEQIKIKTSNSINLLREFRSSLITIAVTGQINVTTWAKKRQIEHQLDRQTHKRM